jgi:hypothetical protein
MLLLLVGVCGMILSRWMSGTYKLRWFAASSLLALAGAVSSFVLGEW